MKKGQRKYTSILSFFHNYEHDPSGLNHCRSDGNFPYEIHHLNGHHVISSPIAIGHGKGNKPQKFKFTKRLGSGYDLISGIKIN